MASLYKHTHGWQIRYRIYFPDGSERIVNRYSKNKQRALAMKQEASILEAVTRRGECSYEDLVYYKHAGFITEDDLSRITGGKKQKMLGWEDLRKEYEKYSRAAHSSHEMKSARGRLNNLERYFKDVHVQGLTPQDILEWQGKRKDEGAAIKTIRHERDALNIMLDMAVDQKVLPFNPGRHRLLKKTLRLNKSRLPVALTYDETKQFLELVRESPELLGGKIYLAALICLFAGLRRGELCYLTHRDINGPSIIVQGKGISENETKDPDVLREKSWKPKGNRARVIDLPKKAADEIQRLLKGCEGRFIFGGDKVLYLDFFSQEFDTLLKKVGGGLSMHCLRHTFVTWRIEHGTSGRGDNLVRVQAVAGHADIKTTMNYTHIKVSPEKDILGLV